MRYRAEDLNRLLLELGCVHEGERYPHGTIWLSPGSQPFFLPDPEEQDGELWFVAEVIDDNLTNRWTGLPAPLPLKRYP